jgi:UV DNA damage endonuclease
MNRYPRFGLFCSTNDGTLSTNRSIKLSSLSKAKVLEIASKNISDFASIVEFCQKRNITMFRLGNSLIPFASHLDFDESIWNELTPLFQKVKRTTLKHNLRLSIHPGQFIQLGSKNPKVVEASLRELAYCERLLDSFEAGDDGVITLHLGGINGDKKATMERFCEVFQANPWLGKYLALENDEYNFNVSETLEVAQKCGIGMIFDIFHHSINPSEVSWIEIKNSWGAKRPKLHISSQGEGKVGHHADFISEIDFTTLQDFLGDDFCEVDIMIEAKKKEDAIEKLFNY